MYFLKIKTNVLKFFRNYDHSLKKIVEAWIPNIFTTCRGPRFVSAMVASTVYSNQKLFLNIINTY